MGLMYVDFPMPEDPMTEMIVCFIVVGLLDLVGCGYALKSKLSCAVSRLIRAMDAAK